jgi:peptidoglycan/xylan/chitin deacetylase (PgdA/CDA1 family)
MRLVAQVTEHLHLGCQATDESIGNPTGSREAARRIDPVFVVVHEVQPVARVDKYDGMYVDLAATAVDDLKTRRCATRRVLESEPCEYLEQAVGVDHLDDEVEIVVWTALRTENCVDRPTAVEPRVYPGRIEELDDGNCVSCGHLLARLPAEPRRKHQGIVAEPAPARAYTHAMRADRAKQLLKNGVYRAIGETVSGAGGLDGEAERSLRVLMYHKVNDLTPNSTTVPTAVFAEQMTLLHDLGYVPVSLEQVRDHYINGKSLPPGAVLITFDDGYRDNLENALPILRRHDYPAVIFVPIGFLDSDRPLPHEEALRTLGVRNETVGWDELAALEAGGIRVESHGIGHRPVSELEPAEAAREIALSKVRLEERLGRPVEAYAFVKGSLADYRPEHVSLVQQAGYTLGFTSVSGANGPTSDRYRLRRYNVEPYPPRTFELVLAGACDLISVKDTVPGTYARRAFNKVLGTATR